MEIAGVEMVLLDPDVAGCVAGWLENGGQLDARRQNVIANYLPKFDLVLPLLTGQELEYYSRLRSLAVLVHNEQSTTDNPLAGKAGPALEQDGPVGYCGEVRPPGS
ncbi:hypothetical protein [Micromonospora sp. NPDC048830]|uniref:hypothetical protein n=1 Tax=Micromonospora sp. NPDC048830 TaxID=3364257 RepID=UPI0037135518